MSFRIAFAAFLILPLAFITLLLALPAPRALDHASNSFAIAAVRVFDGENFSEEPVDVLVENGIITAVGEGLNIPSGLDIIDGAGKTLLPGLIDAHAHVFGDALADAVRFGVTTELDMFTAPELLAQVRQSRDKGTTTGRADLYSAGMLATAPGGHGSQFGVNVEPITSPDAAQDWVDARIAEGSDFIKIVYEAPGSPMPHPSINRDTLIALVDAAHARGRLAVVHAMGAESAHHAIEAGADGLVHVYVQPGDASLVELIRASGAFVTPTLVVQEGFSGSASERVGGLRADLLERLSSAQRATIQPAPNAYFSPEATSNARQNVRMLAAAGVPLLAGADAPNPGTAHGTSVHLELVLLTEAGLSIVDALRAATSAPADAFGLEGIGRIREGARADLLLVEGDASIDITATQNIVAVWKNGSAVNLAIPSPAGDTASAAGDPLPPGLVSDFNSGAPATVWGVDWQSTADDIMQGGSSARIDVRAGALIVEGETAAGFIAPWAGAAMPFTLDWSGTRDLSELRTLRFRVRGAPGRYRVMAFAGDMQGIPPEQSFNVAQEWREIAMPLSQFSGADLTQARAFAIAAGPDQRRFNLEIDDVRLE